MPRKIIIGTRGSKLALIQVDEVISELKKVSNDYEYEIKIIKTHGDKFQSVPIHKLGKKGVFVKEIDKALINGEIDISVHSMKDLPSNIPDGIILGAIPKRKTYKDVLYSRENKSLRELKPGSVIGTGSFRRKSQVLFIRKDVKIRDIRGNFDTRIKKVDDGQYDAIIMAKVGVQRLNLDIKTFELPDFLLPAAGQGALAVETRSKDNEILRLLAKINHQESSLETLAEMEFVRTIGGSCRIPVGILCKIREKVLFLDGEILDLDGNVRISANVTGKPFESEKLGKKLAEKILARGGKILLEELNEKLKEE